MMAANRCCAGAFFCVVVLVLSSSAFAQQLGGQRFTPAGSEDGVLETEGADARIPMHPYVSAWLQYVNDPVVVVDGDEVVGSVVSDVVALDLVGSLTVWRGLEFGVGVPVFLVAAGEDAAQAQTGLSEPGTSLGDVTLRAGYRFRLADHTALALHVPVLLPTSGASNVLGLGFGVRPTAAFMQRLGRFELFFNLSYLIRSAEEALDFLGGDELGFRFGLRWALNKAWRTNLIFDVGVTSALRDFFAPPTTPIEPRVGIEWWFADHWRLTGFFGLGVTTGVGSPDFRVGAGISYGDNPAYRPRPAPTPGDTDGDGIADEEDECPDQPEDPDGFEDEDGCPDADNDQDGIPDVDDHCPSAPETMNDISDEDGCPDRIRLDDTRITTFERVYFKTNSDEIDERSHEMLTEVAAILKVNPDMKIRVEGHTDSRGGAEYNRELSQRRADSVRKFLIKNGASGRQIEAEGLGQSRPIDSNETEEGRARNRRVEFHIVKED
jgi:outer membrane protein OmpA-like peptidoglycan-associated protein